MPVNAEQHRQFSSGMYTSIFFIDNIQRKYKMHGEVFCIQETFFFSIYSLRFTWTSQSETLAKFKVRYHFSFLKYLVKKVANKNEQSKLFIKTREGPETYITCLARNIHFSFHNLRDSFLE